MVRQLENNLGSVGGKFHGIDFVNHIFLAVGGYDLKSIGNKSKNRQMGSHLIT